MKRGERGTRNTQTLYLPDLHKDSDLMYTKLQNKQVVLIKIGSQLWFLQTLSSGVDVSGR